MTLEYSHKIDIIKAEAQRLGFDACGIVSAAEVADKEFFKSWLENGSAKDISYMGNHFEKRMDPRLLVENAKSIIVVALNYFPAKFIPSANPLFSYYAYGKDYHEVLKDKLRELYCFIDREICNISGRIFVDSAPVLERYWAVRAGIGFVGKNTQLIIPNKGSYFFIGEIISDLNIESFPNIIVNKCGSCTNCIEACPANALEKPCFLNAEKCLSYQTIENKGDLSPQTKENIGNRVYGCDVCQMVCPHNRFAKPNQTPEFYPSEEFLSLDLAKLKSLTEEDFKRIFKNSPVKRAGYKGLKRNIDDINMSHN
ncbi:MAG: tRNA epoxyqueuosine(34) reductase QueG [Bacteroidales bacterium]|nr:tRNA epoxyqueuosine(34) reductase QueG [Bacteroidales bacterium]